ncbi:MAG: hypothetical protein K9J06_13880 [Flavobacteriales bacterium]|nr:hypothetical protein [Flavobacteriales bacterium]
MQQPKTDPIKTVLTIVIGLLVVHLATGWKWPMTAALVIGILGMFSDYLAVRIDFLWMKLAYVLSLIVPNILLSAIFFLFLFPVAVLSRIFGKKNALFLRNPMGSTYITNNTVFDKASFEKTW